jgi:hypothetical protein
MVYYSRTLADSSRRDKLFSSGDSPRTLSSILSGEGFDEREQGKSPLELPYLGIYSRLKFAPTFAFPAPAFLHHFKPRINSKTFEKWFERLAMRKANPSDVQPLHMEDKLRLVRAASCISFVQL